MSMLDLGLTAADVADTNDDWYTPRWLFDAAGLTFDVDVCAPVDPTRRTCPARRYLTPLEDGLTTPWEGLVWCNPPYSAPTAWVRRWCDHANGLLLVPPTRSAWCKLLMRRCDAFTLVDIGFLRSDMEPLAPYRTMVILSAIGTESAAALARVGPSFIPVQRSGTNVSTCT